MSQNETLCRDERSRLVLSLFPGIGLLDRAFEEEGFCIVRGPDLLWGGDIRLFHPPAGRFDGVIGGPPCQAFSALANLFKVGNKRQPNLIPEFERVTGEAAPLWFLMENVRQAPIPVVPGYSVHAFLINNRACESESGFGAPQNRVRRFSFGSRDGTKLAVRAAALHCSEWAAAVTAAHGGKRKTHFNRHTGGRIQRYTLARSLELQGLPLDFFAQSPFRVDGQRQMIANGVPLPMGRAIARAVRAAVADAY